MIDIALSPGLESSRDTIRLGWLWCDVTVGENESLWVEIDNACAGIVSAMNVEGISTHPSIASSRKMYRALGKDPARYRLSAEALMRRILKGYGLYRVNNVVDIVNLVSLETGFSIGGYDFGKINFPIELGVGSADDRYEGIGRGELNIENLPVLRDALGPFGSPTSDSVRTSVTLQTTQFMMVVFGFGNIEQIMPALEVAENLLIKFAVSTHVKKGIIEY